MKIEELIVQYLWVNKQVTLQGVGTFTLDPSVIVPTENDKDVRLPDNAVQFEYNLKAEEDAGLVNYIVQHTNKILPLASADLDSYVMLAKQFLNIGKPLVLHGVGTIQKHQQGKYQFVPGVFITPKIDDYPKQVREKRDESVSFESEPRENNSRRNLLISIGVVAILLTALGIFYLLMDKTSNDSHGNLSVPPGINTDTVTASMPARSDTTKKIVVPEVSQIIDGFNIIVKKYTTAKAAEDAVDRYLNLGHFLEVLQVDSSNYELYIPFKSPITDTVRLKDSLRKIFGGKPYVKF